MASGNNQQHMHIRISISRRGDHGCVRIPLDPSVIVHFHHHPHHHRRLLHP